MRATAGNTQAAASTQLASENPQWRAAPPIVAAHGDSDRLLRAMTDVLADRRPASAAEALKVLRLGYPDIPLAMRIAALCAGAK
jgi:hypothetical protein